MMLAYSQAQGVWEWVSFVVMLVAMFALLGLPYWLDDILRIPVRFRVISTIFVVTFAVMFLVLIFSAARVYSGSSR